MLQHCLELQNPGSNPDGHQLNKIRSLHNYYGTSPKKNELGLCVPTWSDVHDIMISSLEKNSVGEFALLFYLCQKKKKSMYVADCLSPSPGIRI